MNTLRAIEYLCARRVQMLKNIIQFSTKIIKQQKMMSSFAKDTYKIKRGNYSLLTDEHVIFFKSLLGETGVLTNSDDLQRFNQDWFNHMKGSSKLVLRPKSTEEVSKILSFCNANQLAVCPQGGNTSISGGSIALHDEIILSLSLMNNIIDLDDDSDVLICEAGCVLENLDNFLNDKNLMMPVDLASKGSCQIGGNIATNAGGLKVLRYGSMHGSVLGLEVVKANGEIIDCLSSLKKDNSGYHLKHLFIGSEGTLGIITKVAIKCVTLPQHYSVAFLGLDSFENVLKTFKCAKRHLNETLSACEMMDLQAMDMVQTHLKLRNPIGDFPFYMLIELSGSNAKHNEEKLNEFIESAFKQNFIVDGTFTCEPGKSKALWEIRERFAESMRLDGYVLMYDLSFRLKDFYTLVPEMSEKLKGKCERVCGIGHLGDGNLHLQISLKHYDEQLKTFIDDIVHKRTQQLKGSISAEHGIGFLKVDILHYSKSESAIQLMRQVKEMMDPNWILNPYKVLAK